MKSKEKGLQKLTVSESKIKKVLKLNLITLDDLKQLNEQEIDRLMEICTTMVNSLTSDKKEEFITKIDPIVNQKTRNQLWEANHNNITWAISTLMQ